MVSINPHTFREGNKKQHLVLGVIWQIIEVILIIDKFKILFWIVLIDMCMVSFRNNYLRGSTFKSYLALRPS